METNKWSKKIEEEEAAAFAYLPAVFKLTYLTQRVNWVSKEMVKIVKEDTSVSQTTFVSLEVFANVYGDDFLLQKIADSIIIQYNVDYDGTWYDVSHTLKYLVRFFAAVPEQVVKSEKWGRVCGVCKILFKLYSSALLDILQEPRRSCSFATLKNWEECPKERFAYLMMLLKD